jgi:hypothetical protein
MPDFPLAESGDVVDLTQRLAATENDLEMARESMADLELAAEDRGWLRLGAEADIAFTRQGLMQIARNCRIMAIASPLMKRAVNLRIAYIFGGGVTVTCRDEDVNTVVQQFWDDDSTQAALTSSQAQEELERALETDGNVFIALFTSPLLGRVQPRSTPFEEIQDVISNPEDRDEPWFYIREYETSVIEPGYGTGVTRTRWERRRVLHPALGYYPASRPQAINGVPINWSAPILHLSVNRLDGQKFGIGDAYAGLVWARAYEGFLTDWAKLVKALSRFAWRVTAPRRSAAQRAAARIDQHTRSFDTSGGQQGVGETAAMTGATLEAIPKTGATIDAESGKPLAGLVAASMGIPLTMLLADPGISGARATAETLDDPMAREIGQRRSLWSAAYKRILSYVIDQSVLAPKGALKGSSSRDDFGRLVVTLTGEDSNRTVDVEWPSLDDLDPQTLVTAIVEADGTGKMPPLVTMRLLLQALGVKDIDEYLEKAVDADGNWIDPDASAAQVAIDAFRNGQDPAKAVA